MLSSSLRSALIIHEIVAFHIHVIDTSELHHRIETDNRPVLTRERWRRRQRATLRAIRRTATAPKQ
jgi:hypothetical protein